jgi:hypothetical protein
MVATDAIYPVRAITAFHNYELRITNWYQPFKIFAKLRKQYMKTYPEVSNLRMKISSR